MKKTLLLFAMVCGLGMLNSTQAQDQLDPTNLAITINNTTTRMELWEIRQSLEAVGIEFKYVPEFDAQRKLTGLEVTVTDTDGASANYKTALVSDDQKIEIVRNLDAEGNVNFCVGKDCLTASE